MDEILYFDYNQKSSVLLIFFFNAVLYSYLLLKNGIGQNKKDSKWLSAFIFLGGLYVCPFMLGYANWYARDSYREFLFFVPFQQLFLIGPVFFFYVRTLLNNKLELTRRDLIHFLPALIYLIYSLIVFISDQYVFEEFYYYADGRDKDLAFWYQLTGLFSMLFYLLLSLRIYQKYRTLLVHVVSFADRIAFKWIKHFIIAFSLVLVLRVLFFMLNPEWGSFGRKYWYYLCFSILWLYIAIEGYSKTLKTSQSLNADLLAELDSDGDQSIELIPSSQEAKALKEWAVKINHLFDTEEVYKNSNLTVTDLAEILETNRNMVSKVINQEFNINFNDFVNQRRAQAVIEQLYLGRHIHNTLLGIALECGFNSKTTFNRAFKKHTGTTPKQYIESNQL